MRWTPKPKPIEGSWRVIIKFALLPVLTTLPTKQYIWLEFYKVNQQCQYWRFNYGTVPKWVDVQIAPYEYWSKK